MATILVLDDEPSLVKLTQAVLERAGHTIHAFYDPQVALEALAWLEPALVLSDVTMPGMSGLEFFRRVKELEKHKNVPFVFLSGRADRADIREGMRLGASDYLTKPFEVQELLETVEVRLRAQHHQQGMPEERYERQKLVGSGSTADVFLAYDHQEKRAVAIKYHRTHLPNTALARLAREYRTLAALDHPGVLKVFEHGFDGRSPFLVMEYIEGLTLNKWLESADPPTTSAAGVAPVLAVFAHFADALEYIHSFGIVHRDLKPENIIVKSDQSVKVMDFGLIKQLASSDPELMTNLTTSGAMVGTITYVAPEQAFGSQIDARADLYSYGVMLYQALTGRPPFEGNMFQVLAGHMNSVPTAPRVLAPHLSQDLEDLLLQLLSKAPNDRPANAATVAAGLRSMEALA
jgi:DNA-binding response OmpR family regulator